MGLDTVELVMEVEDHFGISIPDADAEKIQTVGQLHVYVCQAMNVGPSRRCLSRGMFYRLRRELVGTLGVPRKPIRPRARIEDILPQPSHRREGWRTLAARLEIELPQLGINLGPRVWIGQLVLLSVLILIAGPVLALAYPPPLIAYLWLPAFSACAIAAWAVYRLSKPYAAAVPSECETVAALVRTAVLRDVHAPADAAGDLWTPQSVFHDLRTIIVELMGVKPEQVTMNTHFFNDLEMG